MRKKLVIVIPAIIIAIAIMAIIIHLSVRSSYPQNALTPADLVLSEPENSLTPADIVLSDSHDQETQPMFDKSTAGDNVAKYVFKDFEGGCIYSLNQKIFLLTENSDAEKVRCYLGCATEEKCTPVTITTTGNYLILQTEQGEKIAVQTKQYQMDEFIEPTEPIPFDNLPEQEKNSLFELTEN